jgi:hypothetical protein
MFTTEYTLGRGEESATASVDMPDSIEGPMERWGEHHLSGGGWRPNSDYEAFPPEEGGQGVIFHRTRPTISGWYGTGNAMLNAEALAGAVQSSIKHTGMFPKRDVTLSKQSGAVVANAVGKPSIKESSDFLSDQNAEAYGAGVANHRDSWNNLMLGNRPSYISALGQVRRTTDEERAEAKGALRELPKYKAIYKAMEEGRSWDPNTISTFRDRAAKKLEQAKPERVKPDPNQLELDL